MDSGESGIAEMVMGMDEAEGGKMNSRLRGNDEKGAGLAVVQRSLTRGKGEGGSPLSRGQDEGVLELEALCLKR